MENRRFFTVVLLLLLCVAPALASVNSSILAVWPLRIGSYGITTPIGLQELVSNQTLVYKNAVTRGSVVFPFGYGNYLQGGHYESNITSPRRMDANWTVSAWVVSAGTAAEDTSEYTIFDFSGASQGHYVRMTADQGSNTGSDPDAFRFYCYDENSGKTVTMNLSFAGQDNALNTTRLVSMVKSGSTLSIYLNGTLQTSATNTNISSACDMSLVHDGYVTIGNKYSRQAANSFGNNYGGSEWERNVIGPLAIWYEAKSGTDLTTYYNSSAFYNLSSAVDAARAANSAPVFTNASPSEGNTSVAAFGTTLYFNFTDVNSNITNYADFGLRHAATLFISNESNSTPRTYDELKNVSSSPGVTAAPSYNWLRQDVTYFWYVNAVDLFSSTNMPTRNFTVANLQTPYDSAPGSRLPYDGQRLRSTNVTFKYLAMDYDFPRAANVTTRIRYGTNASNLSSTSAWFPSLGEGYYTFANFFPEWCNQYEDPSSCYTVHNNSLAGNGYGFGPQLLLQPSTTYFWAWDVNDSLNVGSVGAINFTTPNNVTNNAWAYWDFRNWNFKEYYTGKTATPSASMSNWTGTQLGTVLRTNAAGTISSNLSTSDNVPAISTDFTILGWVYKNSSETTTRALFDYSGSGAVQWVKLSTVTSTSTMSISCASPAATTKSVAGVLPLDTWTLVGMRAYLKNASVQVVELWVNGTMVLNATEGEDSPTCVTPACWCNFAGSVGTSPQVKFTHGSGYGIGPFAVWNRVKTPEEMQAFYNGATYYDWFADSQPPSAPVLYSPAAGATGISQNVTLDWTTSTDPDLQPVTYNLFFGTNASPSLNVSGLTTSSYNMTNLQSFTTYYWTVQATDGFATTNATSTNNFTTLNLPPNAPTNESPASNSTNVAKNITLYWNASDPENQALTYDVYFGTNTSPSIVSTNQSSNNYTPTLASHTTYYWRIVARDTQGATTNSSLWNFTTLNNLPVFTELPGYFGPNTSLSPRVNVGKFSSFYWTANDSDNDTLTYNFYADPSFPTLIASGRQSKFRFSELADNLIFTWYVEASDGYGTTKSPASNFWSFWTFADTVINMTTAELRGQSTNNLYVNESVNLYCLANDEAQYNWMLYKNGVLNRTGSKQFEPTSFTSSKTVSSIYGAGVGWADKFMSYVSGGQGKFDVCSSWSSCSTYTFDSNDVRIFRTRQLTGFGTDSVSILYARTSDGYLRFARCDATGVCVNNVIMNSSVTKADFNDRSYGNIGVVGVNATDAYVWDCSADGESCSSQGTTGGTAKDLVAMGGKGYGDVAYDDGNDRIYHSAGQTVVPGVTSLAADNKYAAFTNATGGYFFDVSVTNTPTQFASQASAVSIAYLSTDNLAFAYGNGSAVVYKVCTVDGTCGEEHLIAAVVPTNTSIAETDSYGHELQISYTSGSSTTVKQSSDRIYFSSEGLVATVPASELAIGQNWTGRCVPLSNGRSDAFDSWSNKQTGTGLNSTQKTVLNNVNLPPYFTGTSPANGTTQQVNASISWTADDPNFDVLTYDVYFGQNVSNLTLVSDNQAGTNYSPSMNGHRTYYWYVVVNDSFLTANSSISYFTTENRVVQLANYSPSNGAVGVNATTNLTWAFYDPDGDVPTYDVYFGLNASPSVVSTNQSSTSYDPSISQSNTVHYWRITANDGYNVTDSGVLNFTTANNPPNTPTLISPAAGAVNVSKYSIMLVWNGSDPDNNSLTYNVYFGTNASPELIDTTAASSRAVGTQNFSTTYYWRIVANDSYDTTSSATQNFTTQANVAPTSYTNGYGGSSSGTWTGSQLRVIGLYNGADGNGDTITFNVYFGLTNPPPLWAQGVADNIGDNQAYFNNLNFSTTYYWRVQSNDSSLQSPLSTVQSFTTRGNNTPVISLSSPSNGATNRPISQTLSWSSTDADGDAITHRVYFGTNSSALGLISETTGTSTTVYGLQYLTYYYWKVVGYDPLGAVVNTSMWSFRTRSVPGGGAVCGNSVIESGEQCDDGNTNNGDGCSASCQYEYVCGNGLLQPGEACDDGNTNNGDGCSSTCQIETICGDSVVAGGEECDDGNVANGDGCDSACMFEHTCGNGAVENSEQCDDGNLVDGDGCSSTCQVEFVCGNGLLEAGEACDDGNLVNGDGCDSTCQFESICGNGIVDPGETCDDGNTNNGDGCSSTCFFEAVCGNGIEDPGEACDDGNLVSGDGCSATCTIESVCGNGLVESGEACDDGDTQSGDGCSATCTLENICGNGVLEYGEQCDDGNLVSSDGCSALCVIDVAQDCGNGVLEGTEECDDGNTNNGDGCSSLCTFEQTCGNGDREPGEECDDGNLIAGDGCSASCTVEAECGDGFVGPGEQCDDGNVINGDGCDNTCQYEYTCGNDIREPGEQCDDGNLFGGDGCNALCQFEYVCGNNVREAGEQCDDGNLVSGDGCSNTCRFETICGNGVLEPGEVCDDGNLLNGDGCSDVCSLEANLTHVCGNSILEPSEECDDGNAVDGDGCTAQCLREPQCGNGYVDFDEECDDGNRQSGDGCSAFCEAEGPIQCGNGVLEYGESCDDGNNNDGDGCDSVCRSEFNLTAPRIVYPLDGSTIPQKSVSVRWLASYSRTGRVTYDVTFYVTKNDSSNFTHQKQDVGSTQYNLPSSINLTYGANITIVVNASDGNNYASDSVTVHTGANTPPTVRLLKPDGAKIEPDEVFRWVADDADGDPLAYDVYMGASPVILVASGVTEESYDPPGDITSTSVTFQVVAIAGGQNASTPVATYPVKFARPVGNATLKEIDLLNAANGQPATTYDVVLTPSGGKAFRITNVAKAVCDNFPEIPPQAAVGLAFVHSYELNGGVYEMYECRDITNLGAERLSAKYAVGQNDGPKRNAYAMDLDDDGLSELVSYNYIYNFFKRTLTKPSNLASTKETIYPTELDSDGYVDFLVQTNSYAVLVSGSSPSATCPNGVCDAGERCYSCSVDCGTCPDPDPDPDPRPNPRDCPSGCICDTGGNVIWCNVCPAGCSCDQNGNVLSCSNPVCGNGLLEAGEECDDGNVVFGDGCTGTCRREANQTAWCGDGIIQIGEQCDDGNVQDADGCASNCTIEVEPCPTGCTCEGEEVTCPPPDTCPQNCICTESNEIIACDLCQGEGCNPQANEMCTVEIYNGGGTLIYNTANLGFCDNTWPPFATCGNYTIVVRLTNTLTNEVRLGGTTLEYPCEGVNVDTSTQYSRAEGAYCNLGAQGEFNYVDKVSTYGWSTKGGEPSLDGATAAMLYGQSVAHELSCRKEEINVSFALRLLNGPSDTVNSRYVVYGEGSKGVFPIGYFALMQMGDNELQKTFMPSYFEEILPVNTGSSPTNLYVAEKKVAGAGGVTLKPGASLRGGESQLSPKVTIEINGEQYNLTVGDSIVVNGDFFVEFVGHDGSTCSDSGRFNLKTTMYEDPLRRPVDQTSSWPMGSQRTYTVNGIDYETTLLFADCTGANVIGFYEITMVFNMQGQTYSVFKDGEPIVEGLPFLASEVSEITGVEVENDAGWVIVDYVRSRGSGDFFTLTTIQEALQDSVDTILNGCVEQSANYTVIQNYCNEVRAKNLQTQEKTTMRSSICSIPDLVQVVQKNPECTKAAITYCIDWSIKSNATELSISGALPSASPDDKMDGGAACTTAIVGMHATTNIATAFGATVLRLVKDNIWITIIIVALFMVGAGVRRKRRP